MFEDLDEVVPTPTKRAGKGKSPTKLGPTHWPPVEVDCVCQNRYALDWAEMKDYHWNYLSETDKTTFNLKNHSKYLDIILLKPSITQDVVFMKEAGFEYFEEHKILTALYNQGLLTPLPAVPGSQRFLDKEVVGILYVMVIVAYPSSQKYCQRRSQQIWSHMFDGSLGSSH